MEFRILGALEVIAAGEALSLGRAQQRAVLALLLLQAPEPISRDRLIDELWGERPPATAEHAVQVYVSAIRKILAASGEEVAIRSSGSGYALEVDIEWIDARRFERLVGAARGALAEEPVRSRGLFEQALALWRGAPLSEFSERDFARREADRLEELRAVAVEGLVEARLSQGEHAEVIGQITGLVTANPLRERPRWLLMLALYRAGRHAEALAAYRDAVGALGEIGLQPGPELRRLEDAILRHDETLSAPSEAVEMLAVGDTEHSRAADLRSDPAVDGAPERSRAVGGPLAGRRKIITALFCDVTGSTVLGEELDPEALHGVMNRYWREVRAVIERHGGTVEKFIGDAVVAMFGIPQVREDDALRAVRAAAEIRDRLPAVAEEIGVELSFRTAVNTGVVLAGEGENLAIGDAVNVAARLEQAASPREILLGEETFRLVRDAVQVEPLEPLAVKGKSQLVAAFRLLAVDPLAPGLKRHFERPLVGRDRELGFLHSAWQRANDERGCDLFTLLGAAGVGKSRLVAELLASLGDSATVLRGRCLHYGEGITFWPLIEALTPAGEPAQEVLGHLRSAGARAPEELFFEVRRLLERLASERPVILHVDDLQWAESMLLDLLDHIADLSRGAPILLLCVARPELLDQRSAWGGGKLNATSLLLTPLEPPACELLLQRLGDELAPDVRSRVIAASEGNPLFLEEMTALAREGGTATVPSTIQALLAARLERLPGNERELLERAAIEGEVFHRRALAVLAGEPVGTRLDSRLAGLVRKELVRPHPASLEDDEAFRFRHLLIRDAAYDSLPKAARAALHQRFASWLESNARELPELDEITGWHLEQTVRYQDELGQPVESMVALRAAKHLHAAGRHARDRSDPAALNLLERAHALASVDDNLRVRIGVDLAEPLIDAGELAGADELLSAAERIPEASGLAALIRLDWMRYAQPQLMTQAVESRLPEILRRLTVAKDERGLAKAHLMAFETHWLSGRATQAAEQALLAVAHARRVGDEAVRADALGRYIGALTYGPQHVHAVAEALDAINARSRRRPSRRESR